jgi:hypothetical protein
VPLEISSRISFLTCRDVPFLISIHSVQLSISASTFSGTVVHYGMESSAGTDMYLFLECIFKKISRLCMLQKGSS